MDAQSLAETSSDSGDIELGSDEDALVEFLVSLSMHMHTMSRHLGKHLMYMLKNVLYIHT